MFISNSILFPVGSELLILSLDLVKNRVGVMGVEMRKAFIGTILVGLIEKTPDVKVMKAITKVSITAITFTRRDARTTSTHCFIDILYSSCSSQSNEFYIFIF